MMTIIKILTLTLIRTLEKNSNPVKIGIALIVLRALLLLILTVEKRNIWIPRIFFILFIGGILIIFMILSSLRPNEKSIKIKISVGIIILILTAVTNFHNEFSQERIRITKSILNSIFSTTGITILLVAYFLTFISILNKRKNTLRTSLCQK